MILHSRPSEADQATAKLLPATIYQSAEFPKRHNRDINDDDAVTEWLSVRDKVINRLGSGFMLGLIGKRGTGKTQIAERAGLYCAGTGRSSLYVRALTIFLQLRATYRSETDTELAVIERLRAPSLLVIDEVQERGESDWENRMLTHVLDLRYGDMRDTLLIANLTPAEFQQSLGASIVDRIRETGGVIECNWTSYRKASK